MQGEVNEEVNNRIGEGKKNKGSRSFSKGMEGKEIVKGSKSWNV